MSGFVGSLGIFFGGLCTLTGLFMTIGMLLDKQTFVSNLFWVGLLTLFISPPVVIASIRLLLNKPNKYGGLFSQFTLRSLAVLNGIIGGMIVIFAVKDMNVRGVIGGISFLITTQAAFVLANYRASHN